jgi:hypothetical protein
VKRSGRSQMAPRRRRRAEVGRGFRRHRGFCHRPRVPAQRAIPRGRSGSTAEVVSDRSHFGLGRQHLHTEALGACRSNAAPGWRHALVALQRTRTRLGILPSESQRRAPKMVCISRKGREPYLFISVF